MFTYLTLNARVRVRQSNCAQRTVARALRKKIFGPLRLRESQTIIIHQCSKNVILHTKQHPLKIQLVLWVYFQKPSLLKIPESSPTMPLSFIFLCPDVYGLQALGPSSLEFALDDVECTGNEHRLSHCFAKYSSHCHDHQTAGVRCLSGKWSFNLFVCLFLIHIASICLVTI